jgi:hypothetical protein
MRRLSGKLTYSNVVSTLCLFLLLGGGAAYAASQLGKNSVGAKQLKKNAVTTAKIQKEAVTATKVKKGTLTGKQVDASTLGTVPAAQTAQTASSLSAPEAWHVVGAPGEPVFQAPFKDESSSPALAVAFFKDHEGVVHLTGFAAGGPSSDGGVFHLPPGFRPPSGKILNLQTGCNGIPECNDGVGSLDIYGSGFGASDGLVQGPFGAISVRFEEIIFRAES